MSTRRISEYSDNDWRTDVTSGYWFCFWSSPESMNQSFVPNWSFSISLVVMEPLHSMQNLNSKYTALRWELRILPLSRCELQLRKGSTVPFSSHLRLPQWGTHWPVGWRRRGTQPYFWLPTRHGRQRGFCVWRFQMRILIEFDVRRWINVSLFRRRRLPQRWISLSFIFVIRNLHNKERRRERDCF